MKKFSFPDLIMAEKKGVVKKNTKKKILKNTAKIRSIRAHLNSSLPSFLFGKAVGHLKNQIFLLFRSC